MNRCGLHQFMAAARRCPTRNLEKFDPCGEQVGMDGQPAIQGAGRVLLRRKTVQLLLDFLSPTAGVVWEPWKVGLGFAGLVRALRRRAGNVDLGVTLAC
jgi:hypothetical protein